MTTKKALVLLTFISITLFSFGQDRFVRELTYDIEKDAITAEVREKAVTEIKRILLDELGSYIVSQASRDVTEDNSRFEEKYKSKTKSISMSLMKTRIIEEERRNKSFYIKVAIDIDDKGLQKNLEDAGLKGSGNVLIKVFEMLQENNVPSVSTKVLNTVTSLLNGLSVMEYSDSGERIYNVSRNFQGQILDGDIILSGKCRIIYSGGNYTIFNLDNGYLTGIFERYDVNNNIIEKGEFKESKREGLWEGYRVDNDKSYVILKTEYRNGMKNGKMSVFNIYGELESARLFEDDIPLSEELYESQGMTVFKGPLDKYGKKDGEWYYMQGDIKISESSFINGKKHGNFVTYYTSGQISSEGRYENDNQVGICKTYYDNGQLEEEKEYDQNGNRTGNTYQYYKDGVYKATYIQDKQKGTKKVSKYYANGNVDIEENYLLGTITIKHGKFLKYYEDGTLKSEMFFENNMQTGLSAEYFEDGSVRRQYNFTVIGNTTVKNGAFVDYDKNKKLWKSENYKKGVYDGLQEYYTNGLKSKEAEYKDGVLLWNKDYYFPDGQLKSHNEYPSGGNPSIEKKYYESGQLKSIAYNIAPKKPGDRYYEKTGEHKNYSDKGILLNSTIYKNNKKNGLSISYDNLGKIKSSQMYVDNKREGTFVSYFGGILKETGEYKNNDRYGVWYKFLRGDEIEEKTYDENGRAVESKTYEDASLREHLMKELSLE